MITNAIVGSALATIVICEESERAWFTLELETVGYTVIAATHERLLETTALNHPTIILLDADMRVAPDPIPTLERLRADPRTRDVPVILLIAPPNVFDATVWMPKILPWKIPARSKPFKGGEELRFHIDRLLAALKKYPADPAKL